MYHKNEKRKKKNEKLNDKTRDERRDKYIFSVRSNVNASLIRKIIMIRLLWKLNTKNLHLRLGDCKYRGKYKIFLLNDMRMYQWY